MSTSNLSWAIAEVLKYLPFIRELSGRIPPIQKGVVTELKPDERLAKVTTQSKGGESQSYWVQCGRTQSHTDEPLPKIGTTVLVAFADGNATDVYILRTLANDTNPPDRGQGDPENDNTTSIPGSDSQVVMGDRDTEIRGDESQVVEGEFKMQVRGGELVIECTPKASDGGDIALLAQKDIDLNSELGRIRILSKAGVVELSGQQILLRQGGATLTMNNGGTWDLGGQNLTLVNVGTYQVSADRVSFTSPVFLANERDVLVLGSTDSGGDVNDTRGY